MFCNNSKTAFSDRGQEAEESGCALGKRAAMEVVLRPQKTRRPREEKSDGGLTVRCGNTAENSEAVREKMVKGF